MRTTSHHLESAGRSDSTMTPMIDVVFLLLIFFVCTASFQIAEQNLPSSLQIPAGTGAQDVEIDPELMDLEDVIIKIFWDGQPRWEINGEAKSTLGEVRSVLAAIAQVDTALPVILDVADQVPLGNVINVYDISRAEGFNKIHFAADVGATGGS